MKYGHPLDPIQWAFRVLFKTHLTFRSLHPRRVLAIGATGTIGQATVAALVQAGHEVVCLVRPKSSEDLGDADLFLGATIRLAEVTDFNSVTRDGVCGERFDAVVSCLASRSGAPKDAWAIDYQAQANVLEAAKVAGVTQMVLLSAICVQKPRLAFQHAKLAFEAKLIESGINYSIVRATAFFKSLSGQVGRIKQGKPFLVFGDGTATACKPISDSDLAEFIVECLDLESRRNQILPIGGPGQAITPREQGELLFSLLNVKPRIAGVPVLLLDVVIFLLTVIGWMIPRLADKAELARIGRYYATESMLVLNPATGEYDASITPAAGSETLASFYSRLLEGKVNVERGDHAVF